MTTTPRDAQTKKPLYHDGKRQGTCDVRDEFNPTIHICDRPATLRYPCAGGGYMRLCGPHGRKHADYCAKWYENLQAWGISQWEQEGDPR